MSNSLTSLTAQYTDSEGEEDRPEAEDMSLGTQSSRSTPPQSSNFNSPQLSRDGSRPKISHYDLSEGDEPTSESDEDEGLEMHKPLAEAPIDEGPKRETEADKWLPKEVTKPCSKELQDTISRMYQRKIHTGYDHNAQIQNLKSFRNPSIYERLVHFFDINELGTNYPPELYDPHMWGKESFYEELSRAQKEEMEKRERERKEKVAKVQKELSSTSAIKRAASPPPADDKRRSKWDQVGPSVVSSASGTKTAISAFGSLKKSKS